MSSTFTDVCNALKTALETIDGLHVYAFPPGQIQPPAAVIAPPDGDFVTYDTAAGQDNIELTVTLFVQQGQYRTAYEAVFSYLLGAGSIRDAVAADPDLGGLVDSCRVLTARNFGDRSYGTAEAKYPGAEFPVEILL